MENHKAKMRQLYSNREEFKKLGIFLKRIYQGAIPDNLFNMKSIARASQFRITGLKNSYVKSLSKKLIRKEKIKLYNEDYKLSKFAQNVFLNYQKNQIKKIPGHEPILKNILIKDKDSIAIEVPIWYKNNVKNLTGHIDLIQIDNNRIKVIDYKPEGKFFYSLPQVATYGLLIKKLIKTEELTCISFNKNKAWEYKPELLLSSDLKEYLMLHKVKRTWENYI